MINNSNNFFQLVAEFQKNIDWLNQVLKGSESDSVNIDGVVKPSISKDIEDKWAAIRAMVQGRIVYETKAIMDAAGAPPNDELAEVWRDSISENNGLYGWTGSVWEKSKYDFTSELNRKVDPVIDHIDDAGLQYMEDEINERVFWFSDEAGQSPLSIDTNGNIRVYSEITFNGGAVFEGEQEFKGPATLGSSEFTYDGKEDGRLLICDSEYQVVAGVQDGEFFVGQTSFKEIDGSGLSVMDADGRVALKIDENGAVDIAGMSHEAVGSASPYIIMDSQGLIAFRVNIDGSVYIPVLESQSGQKQDCASEKMLNRLITPEVMELPPLSDYVSLMMYGQSLSHGVKSSPTLSTTPLTPHKMFNFGAFSGDTANMNANPLRDYYETGTTETPTYGALEMITLLCRRENSSEPPVFLAGGCGRGGQNIKQLSKGGDQYPRAIKFIRNGMEASSEYGRGVSFGGTFWVQGENDVWGTSYESYLEDILQLRKDLQSERPEQQAEMPMFTYQTGPLEQVSSAGTHRFNVMMAQWQATKMDPYIFLAAPCYHLQYADDDLHLTNVGSKLLGAYLGKAWKRVMIDGIKWRPVEPISAVKSGKTIEVKVHVPNPPLTIEPGISTAGFEVYDHENDQYLAVSSVEVSGDVVKLRMEAELPDAVTIHYARFRDGCIRDTATEHEYIEIEQIRYDLHNYLIAFEKRI